MNKQEYQQKIKNMKRPKFFNAITLDEAYEAGFEEAKNNALFESCFLDEPEKPVVPQFVADWYESINYDFEHEVYDLCVKFHYSSERLSCEIKEWFNKSENNPIQTLVAMHKYGYEVEKEKLYTVSLKRNGIGIGVQQDGSFKERFAKEELKEYGFDNLDEYEVEEVKE